MGIAARVGSLTGKRQLLLAFLVGAAMGLVQAPWSFPFILFISLPVIFWLHSGARSRGRAGAVGWFVGLGYFGLTLAWIVEPFLVDVGRHGWMAPFALMFLSGGLALFWAAAFWSAPKGRVLVLVGVWTLVELARSYLFTGFPWALVGHAWVETPIIQAVSMVGAHGLGFLTLMAFAFVSRLRAGAVLAGLGILATLWAFGSYRLSQPVEMRAEEYVVRIVQPNVEQKLKWLPEFQQTFFQRHLELTGSAGAPDVVIWPEAAVPFLPEERADLLQDISYATRGAETILGARRRDDTGAWFNRLLLLNGEGVIAANYDKHHLVPFGEYVPLKAVLSKIGLSALTGTGWTAGEGPRVIDREGTPAFLPLICYEAIFPQHATVKGARAEWIVQITNDAWFGQYSGPYQHFAQAQIRAIEQGLPLARSANTGVSGLVDPYGRVIGSIVLGAMGIVDIALPAALPKTLYARYGDWVIIVMLLLLTGSQLLARIKRNP